MCDSHFQKAWVQSRIYIAFPDVADDDELISLLNKSEEGISKSAESVQLTQVTSWNMTGP